MKTFIYFGSGRNIVEYNHWIIAIRNFKVVWFVIGIYNKEPIFLQFYDVRFNINAILSDQFRFENSKNNWKYGPCVWTQFCSAWRFDRNWIGIVCQCRLIQYLWSSVCEISPSNNTSYFTSGWWRKLDMLICFDKNETKYEFRFVARILMLENYKWDAEIYANNG